MKLDKKDEFDLIDVYIDTYPLLDLRKWLMKIIKGIQFVCYSIVISELFSNFILIVIVTNSIFMAADDPLRTLPSNLFDTQEIVFVCIYIAEASLKIIGSGMFFPNFEGLAYFTDPWNILDGIIVITSVISLFFVPSSNIVDLPPETGAVNSSTSSLST